MQNQSQATNIYVLVYFFQNFLEIQKKSLNHNSIINNK